jgi:hypothetical protein
MRDGQIVVVGGYTGKDSGCDSPGIYVFDASTLKWVDRFSAGDHKPDFSAGNSVQAGSFGYKVPDLVQIVVGGGPEGGATITSPVASATDGPFATGKPPIYTVTDSRHTQTVTQWGPTGTGAPGAGISGQSADPGSGSRASAGLIAAGVIAGLCGLLAGYLGFCAWLYRRQVQAYKNHLAVTNRYSGVSSGNLGKNSAAVAGLFGRNGRSHRRVGSTTSEDSFGWVGAAVEPKWLSDETTPGSGTGSGSGSGQAAGFTRPEDRRTDYGFTGDGRLSHGDENLLPHRPVSHSSAEGLMDGQEPSFFSVVMGPRRALRVVNGMD